MEYNRHCPHLSSVNEVVKYSADSNLFFLRDDLGDELGAVVGYLECAALAQHQRIRELFSRIAGEEAGHFIRLARMICSLDPVQAEQLKRQELTVLTLINDGPALPESPCGNCLSKEDRPERKSFQGERYYKPGFKEREFLGNAIRDELRAINAYQKQVQITASQSIQNLLIVIMNREKEHLAQFIRLFYDLQHSN